MIIRKALNIKEDCDFVFTLSNDPIVRHNSFNQEIISYESHCKWYKSAIEDDNTLFFLVFESDSFVGQIRFKRNDINSEECVISLSISESFRGKHISEDFIRLGICELQNNWKNIKFIIAEVKDDNIASNKLFSNMEFELVSTVNTYKFNTKL